MSKKDRLFVFGDSWGCNLFREEWWLQQFFTPFPSLGIPFHVTDYLSFHYDVHNFAIGAASNQEILYQLSNLPSYKEGDRIIIFWSHFTRFSLWSADGRIKNYGDFNLSYTNKKGFQNGNAPEEIYDSLLGRLRIMTDFETGNADSLEDREKAEQEILFYTKILDLLSKWEPVAVTWDVSLAKLINIDSIDYSATFYDKGKATIKQEYGLDDHHLGGRGNYQLYKFILNKLIPGEPFIDQLYRQLEPNNI